MTVIQGNAALASDYNTLATNINKWFADNYAGSISFGNSNQTYGWGGTPIASVIPGDDMEAAQMNQFVDRCNIGVDVVDSVSNDVDLIIADEDIVVSDYNDSFNKSNSINTNRLDITSGELSLLAGAVDARTTSYSAAIDNIFRYDLIDFDSSRYFWNTGGALNISGVIIGYSTGGSFDGDAVDDILTTMGTITMDRTQTIQSGSGGTPTSIGFYDLTTSWQTIFSQIGSGAYSSTTLLIEARRDSLGSYAELRVTITPEGGETVDGTTTITSQFRKLDSQSSGSASLAIVSPVASVQDTFE